MARKSQKENIISAAISSVANKGLSAATIRTIASLAGVTEGAIYRHFPSKDALIRAIYERIVLKMVQTKEKIALSPDPFQEKISQWVRVTYEFFDEQPDAFVVMYLTPHNFDEKGEGIVDRQGEIFMELIRNAQDKGLARAMDPSLALSHFTGVELNVPRLIREGRLTPPAKQYVSQVVDAILRVFSVS